MFDTWKEINFFNISSLHVLHYTEQTGQTLDLSNKDTLSKCEKEKKHNTIDKQQHLLERKV